MSRVEWLTNYVSMKVGRGFTAILVGGFGNGPLILADSEELYPFYIEMRAWLAIRVAILIIGHSKIP